MSEPPLPGDLCEVCRNLNLVYRILPFEDEEAIPHQPTLTALEASSHSCALCYQVWATAGHSLANRGGMTTTMPTKKLGDRHVQIQVAISNYALGGLMRGMANGASVMNLGGRDSIEPDFGGLDWVNPRRLVGDPNKCGSYLFGNWWYSAYEKNRGHYKLIGLGVRLGTSPRIGDALGNTPNKWFLAGSFLRFRTDQDMEGESCIPGRLRHWDLSSSRAMAQVKLWLRRCNEHRCVAIPSGEGNEEQSTLPTRVLFVGSKGGVVKLEESQGRRGRYVALSHSWGKSHRLTTTRSNIDRLKVGISFDEIPQTFKDAVVICRALDVAYLWIDSLCIIQDDPADWEVEASRMGGVYSGSYLTISALHSADDMNGCFPKLARTREAVKLFSFASPDVVCTGRPVVANAVPFVDDSRAYRGAVGFSSHQEKGNCECKPPNCKTGFQFRYCITNEWMPSSIKAHPQCYATSNFGVDFDPLQSEPLSLRGWVLQERLLSPRTLHYSEGQMYFECQQMVHGEDGSILRRMFPRLLDVVESRRRAVELSLSRLGAGGGPESVSDASENSADEWLKLVEVFSRRNLTVAHDKLVALSGLARIVAEKSGDEYLAGLWKSNFFRGLCWERKTSVPVHHCDDEAHDHALPEPRSAGLTWPAQYRAPSWSWAAVDGEIHFENTWLKYRQERAMVAQLLDVDVSLAGSDAFGRVKSGYARVLTVVGELREAVLPRRGRGDPFRVEAILMGMKDEDKHQPIETNTNNAVGDLGNRLAELELLPQSQLGCSSPLDANAVVTADASAFVRCGVSARVLFDGGPHLPCMAVFVNSGFLLALAWDGDKGGYRRVGTASLFENDSKQFLEHLAVRREVVIF